MLCMTFSLRSPSRRERSAPKSDYEALAQQLDVIDSVRRDLGKSLESLTASTQSEIESSCGRQVHTLQQARGYAAASSQESHRRR